MSRRNRGVRAAEILLAAVFVIVLFLVETAVVKGWFSSSMNNALEKIVSSINDSVDMALNDFDQQFWSKEQILKLAAYYAENDGIDTDTEESFKNLSLLFNADGAYLIDQKGKTIAGYGDFLKTDVFQEEYFEALRKVSKKNPCSDPLPGYMLPQDLFPDWQTGDDDPLFMSCYLSPGKILVLQSRLENTGSAPDQEPLLLEWNGIVSNRVFGSDSFCFATMENDPELLFLSEKDGDEHPDLVGNTVPEQARQDGFSGFIKLGDRHYFCCTKYSADHSLFIYCAVHASSFYRAVLFVSVSVLVVVFFFLSLMRMYTRLLLPDAVKDLKKKEPQNEFRKHLGILLLAAALVTLGVNIFINTLYLYTERIETDSEKSAQLSEILDGFSGKQQASSVAYNRYIAAVTQTAADLIPQNPEFMKSAKLQELADVMGAARILVYDNSGTVIASSRNYNGMTLSDDPKDMSYEFRWVLRGEPPLIQDKPDENYLNQPYRYSGASMTDPEGNFTGLVQIAMDPSVYESMESSLSLKAILTAFETDENTVVLAVDSEDGRVFTADDRYEGETTASLGISEEVLQDDFSGFFRLKKEKMLGSNHNCEGYHAIVASQTKTIPAAGFRSGVVTALPGIFTEVLFFLILVFYVKSCGSMTEEETRLLERGRKKETLKIGEQLHNFAYRYLYVITGVISLMYFFRYSLFAKGSVGYYIFVDEWARGFHIFSITRCLIWLAVAVFSVVTVSKLFTAIASLTISRQETFIRMGLSFLKYGAGIAVVFLCASQLGAPTASLLASAGVLSVVLSFGAQNIVADIIAGLFIVFEGTFKVGDMITVDDWHGQVQEIGIRNTTIRDLISEDVKIMNNSTIRAIINFSERPCWTPILVGVDYATDIPAMEAAFEREKAAMKKNIPQGIGEIVYMGIDELSDSQMTLKFQIQCRKQDQPKVKRALNREIRLMFARNGITIPFPQVTLSSREEPEEKKTEDEQSGENPDA